jgi:molybdopterin-guanine dinucleotide biosynthesis protein A
MVSSIEAAIGFVLAGGRSTRMGRDKALLPWAGATLLDHVLTRLREVCPDARILSGADERYADHGAPVYRDILVGAGALGGVYTGLSRLEGPAGLFLAVDLPLVPATLLRRLLELAEGYDVVVPVSPGGPEPLCAVYGRGCLEPIRQRAERGELAMTAFWPDVRVRRLGVRELLPFGDPAEIFRNVNTPEDYARAGGEPMT